MASHAALEVVWAVEREKELRLERRKLKVVSQVREESGAVTEEQLLSLSEDSSRVVDAMEDMVLVTFKCLHITILYTPLRKLAFSLHQLSLTNFFLQ